MSRPQDPILPNAFIDITSDSEYDELALNTPRTSLRLKRRRRSRFCSPLLGCCTIAGWVLGVATFFAWRNLFPQPDVFHPESLARGINLCDCGANIQEALQRGCVYDTLSTSWLPPYCRDAEVTAKFDKSGDGPNGEWSYFADQEGTQRLSIEEIAAFGDTGGHFWASRYWHRVHCLFYWQKQYRQRYTGVVMEQRFEGLSHVEHCSRLLMHTTNVSILLPVPVLMNSSAADAARLSPEVNNDHSHHLAR